MFRRCLLLGLSLAVILLCVNLNPAHADPQLLFFPETGQTIADEIYQFWQSTPHPLQTLGYPISRPFLQVSATAPGSFLQVQYFERAVLEEHPTPDGHILVLGRLLGDELVARRHGEVPFQPVPRNPNTAANWDDITRHTVADTPAPFKSFYAHEGGLPIFGRPLSEQFLERNQDTGATYWVQYFERQRMEWHPMSTPLFQVMLGRLGDEDRRAHPEQIDPSAFIAPNTAPAVPERFIYGVNATLFYTDRERAVGLVHGAGFSWIRQQVRWKDHQGADHQFAWGDLDAVVEAAQRQGLKLLLSIDQAPDWATGVVGASGLPDRPHYADYAAFVGAMAQRYHGRVQGYEIWNEINLELEDAPQPIPIPADYVDLLAQSYAAIKAADPEAVVVSTPLAPTEWAGDQRFAISDITYFKALFADPRFWAHVDVVGVHLFGCSNPPDTLWPEQPGPGPGWTNSREFYFRYIEDIHQLVVNSGHSSRQIWVTEFGWATANNTPGHEFGNNVSFDQQATYLVRALEMGRYQYTPWLGAMFVWNLNFAVTWSTAGNPRHQMASYGILNADWSPRPAYSAIQHIPKQ